MAVGATSKIIDILASYTKTMDQLSKNYMNSAIYDRTNFEEKTNKQSDLNNYQGWTVILSACVGAGFGGAGAFGTEKMKPICDIGYKFCTGISGSIDPFFRSPLTKMEGARQLTEKKLREDTEGENTYHQAALKAIDAAERIVQAEARA